jgi:FlaA1/EpsC-like NDP-sugar epimerase
MESCPSEAIKNNVFGTYHVVRAAEKFGVKKFVMISTDKAVNPTNFMGATKRFCEMILQSRANSTTEFCAVRFGNVLGSNGSVVPLFKKQIEEGGPITLTDKRIIRYFMTIPEAAQLVLEAGAMARQNQVFVLDMGEPVKILELAENLIRLSGLEPYEDIQIEEIGLRPGEKLYEELLMNNDNLTKTANKKIFVEEQAEIVPDEIMANLVQLDEAVTKEIGNEELIALMKSMVPTYHAPQEVNNLVHA